MKRTKKFQLQTFVSLAEILSSLAVVISIIYLVNEYKRTTVLNTRNTESFIYDRMMELDRLLIENAELAGIVLKIANEPDSLSPTEKLRYLAYEHIFYDSWESLWVNHREGIVDRKTWNSWNSWFIAEAKRRNRLGWIGNEENFDEAFRAYLAQVFNQE